MFNKNYLTVLIVWNVVSLSHGSTCESNRYVPETFTELLNSDMERTLSSYGVCLSLCVINQSCAAMSYSRITSACTTSGEPSVVSYPEDDDEQLTLVKESHSADLKVYEFSTLLARKKPVAMSSTYSEKFVGAKAVDGIYLPPENNNMLSMAHTKPEQSPWLQVDLQTKHYVLGVKIWNRSMGEQELQDRLANVLVEVDAGFSTETKICNYLPGKPPVDPHLMTCHTRVYGRYVRLTANSTNKALNIYEIEVHGLSLS